jgi:hypothetical protein
VIDTRSFIAALRSAGHTVKSGRIVIPPGYGGFDRLAQKIDVDGIDVWAFEFRTRAAYKQMRSRISDDGQRIGSASFVWTPHLYGSGRLIVLYVGDRSTPPRDALNAIFGRQFAGV